MGIVWNWKRANDLGKINNLRIRIESLLVKTRSFGAERIRNFKRAREERYHGNIPLRLDPSKRRIDPWLAKMTSPRFLKHVYMDNCAKTRSYKLKVMIFLKFWTGLEWIFGPKHVILSILRVKTGHWINLISTIDHSYK